MRRQAAADDHDRQPNLQVGERIAPWPRRSVAAPSGSRTPVRTPRARPFCISITVGRPAPIAQRDVVEAQFEGVVDGQRAAEAHAAEHREFAAPLQQQADHLQEVLVPAHRDAVFGDAAEAGQDALVRAVRSNRRCRAPDRKRRGCRRCATPRMSPASGSIFKPSMPTTVWPSFIR